MKSNKKLTPLMERRIMQSGNSVHKAILQEYKKIEEERTIAEHIYQEGLRLSSLGYTTAQINEEAMTGGLIGNLVSAGGEGFFDVMKESIGNWLLEYLGLDSNDPGGWGLLGCAIKNSIGQINAENF